MHLKMSSAVCWIAAICLGLNVLMEMPDGQHMSYELLFLCSILCTKPHTEAPVHK